MAVAIPVITTSSAEAHPVDGTTYRKSVNGVDASAKRELVASDRGVAAGKKVAAITPRMNTESYDVLMATWSETPGDDDVQVSARVRTDRGGWGPWFSLEREAEHGPDPDTPEGKRAAGHVTTEPAIAVDANGVQVLVESEDGMAPSDLEVILSDGGKSDYDAEVGSRPASSAEAAASQPEILTREDWGADEGIREDDPSYGSTVKVGFVHHTAHQDTGANDYTPEQTPEVIRAIYEAQVASYWGDISYNFIVDKYGRVWEGRYGGVDKPVIGGHTANYNTDSVGVAALGNFTEAMPDEAVLDAYGQTLGWKLDLHGRDPMGRYTLTNGATQEPHEFNAISGHRDAKATECPGDNLYASLGTIRERARASQGATLYDTTVTGDVRTYGDGTATTVAADVPGPQSWSLEVVPVCEATPIRTLTGTSTSGRITATWDGRTDTGELAPPGSYRLALSSASETSAAVQYTTYVDIHPTMGSPAPSCDTERLAGRNRYETAVAIGQEAYPSSDTVVIASGNDANLVDGLVAGPLAQAKGGPVLLATPEGLPSATDAEIRRRGATTAYLVGGTSALGTGVESDLRAAGVTNIQRLGGANRYDTAATVARALGGTRSDVVIASGRDANLVDALAASGPAAKTGRPILLVSPTSVPSATQQALTDLGVERTVVAGGPSAVSDDVMTQLPAPERVGGANRYGTAAALASYFEPLVGVDEILIASGEQANLVDALVGGALGRVTLLTPRDNLSPTTASWLEARPEVGTAGVAGGRSAVHGGTFEAVADLVAR